MSNKSIKISLEKDLEKYIIRDPFEKFLGDRTKNGLYNELNEFIESSLVYYRALKKENTVSRARVIYVSPNELPSGDNWKVLGQYNTANHTIKIANNLSPDVERFVYYHEEAHSIGIMDERIADDYAAAKAGYHLRRDYGLAA